MFNNFVSLPFMQKINVRLTIKEVYLSKKDSYKRKIIVYLFSSQKRQDNFIKSKIFYYLCKQIRIKIWQQLSYLLLF